MVSNPAAGIHQLQRDALDPDHLEQVYAAGMARQMAPGYQAPFLFGAMIDRQRRGQMLADANARANAEAARLGQEALNVEERGQLRTLTGVGYGHGVPGDPNLLMVGGMPTPESATRVAALGGNQVMQESDARAAQAFGAGAHGALQGGVSPNALPGMMSMARETPLGVQTAAIGAAGRNRTQFRSVINPNDPDTPQRQVTAGTIEQMQQGEQQLQDSARRGLSESSARQLIQQHPPVAAAVQRERESVARAGGTIVGVTGDANSVTITARDRAGQTHTRTIDRSGAAR